MKLLVAVDLSKSAQTVIDQAQCLATPGTTEIWILHVADPNPDFVGYEAGPQTVRDAVAEEYHEEHRTIQAWAAAVRARGCKCTALLVSGPVAETILSEADKLQADLIALGSHGRGVVGQIFLGSTSEAVIRHATRPVLVVPPGVRPQLKHATPSPDER